MCVCVCVCVSMKKTGNKPNSMKNTKLSENDLIY